MRSLPIIDLSARDRAANSAELARNCEEIGFFMLQGHGVPPDLLQRMRAVCYRLFDLPLAEKLKVAVQPNSNRGYRGVRAGSLALSAGNEAPPDLRETFLMGPPDYPPDVVPVDCFEPNRWSASLPEMEEVFTAYYRAMADLSGRVLDLAAEALGLPERYFRPFIDRCISQLSIANYPEQPVPPLPSQLRASAHTDFGTLTLLLAEDKPGGLQILDRRRTVARHRAAGTRLLCRQSRRPDGALDERSVALDHSPRRQSAARGRCVVATGVDRVLPPPERTRGDRMPAELREPRTAGALSGDDARSAYAGESRRHLQPVGPANRR